MKKSSLLASALVFLLVAGLVSIYWQIRNVDPEGACKDRSNFSMCMDAWIEYSPYFKALPTDQEMIDRFNKQRGDFDEIRDKVISQQNYYVSFIHSELRNRTGVYDAGSFGYWPLTTYTASHEPTRRNFRQSWQFRVDETMYIKDAGENWPHVNRVKGYAYFPLPVPQVEHGRLIGPVRKSGQRFSWRVLDQLDRNWPADWVSDECLLRRIEPQWFLFICKDHIGG